MKKTEKENSRRNFLAKIGTLGLGSLSISSVITQGCDSKSPGSESGKKVTLLNSSNELVEVDSAYISTLNKNLSPDHNSTSRNGLPGKKFVLVVDLARCKNARKCMDKCQAVHQLRPEQHHLNVLLMKDSEHTAPYYMPKHCQHCDNPPCVKVCPVDATFKRSDGIVLIDNERCIGCRFCIAACPYSARSFNWYEPRDADKYKDVPYDIEKNVPQKKGTVTKCTFSADCLREGKLPYCVSACPNGVYYFGNIYQDSVTNGTSGDTVILSELLAKNAGYRLMEDLGTAPSVYYLPPKDRTMLPESEISNG
ncbi:MAG: 4Fe-4S dicluster domain-containing protein [Bacteroidales bacterium]|nr:4Fe-4S dicluster domain-containing protein [Bacteroidales bacterium]